MIIMAVYIFEKNFFAESGDIIHATRRVCMNRIGTETGPRGSVVIYGNVSVTQQSQVRMMAPVSKTLIHQSVKGFVLSHFS